MQYRELVTSGVEVCDVGFGAWVAGIDWWGDRSADDAVEVIHHALDRGITRVDAGDVYGHGRSEELLGEVPARVRGEVTIATRTGYVFYDDPGSATANSRQRRRSTVLCSSARPRETVTPVEVTIR